MASPSPTPAMAAAGPGPFDLAATPLEPGTWLIQASAGTGKTFTLSGLFLRLLLERDFPVREILVVTFTEAATGELRDRIRRGLARARQAVDDPQAGDAVIAQLLQRADLPPDTLRNRLERALRAFDEAPIHTIHSFCQRALRDRAFESGELFDTELLTDDSDLRQQVADDFWRRTFHEASPATVGVLLRHGRSPEHLAELLSQHSRHPELTVISGVDDRSLADLSNALDARLEEARRLWRGERRDILRALDLSESALQGLSESPDWAINKHGKPRLLGAALAGVEECLGREGTGPTGHNLKHLEFLSPTALAKGTSKRAETPTHRFFDLCADWEEAAGNFLIGVDLAFLRFAQLELPRRKRALKVQSFDDLLTRLRDALRSPGGAALGAELRGKFRAALIDEFQDTDPVQWEIFRTVFGGAPAAGPAPCLFLIGDPKQAIYGFRGADIFTYLDAARGVPAGRSFTLDKNWRSEARLVQAVNALFSAAPDPFACPEIGFHPVTAAGEADEKPLTENGQRPPPLRLWFTSRGDRKKTISKKEAEGSLPAIVAGEIVRLLQGDLRLGDRRLSPRDIAVLVLENRQAALLQQALRAVGVPAVLHTEESVFATREARELKLALAALAQPGHERTLRAALATDLLGRSGTDLDHLARHATEWESLLEQNRRLNQLWLDRGFVPLFREWLNQHEVRHRLLRFEDGERRLTNLLHLAEVLHAAAHEHRLGPAGIVRWLDEQLTDQGRAREEHQLRLERDDEAVRLVTVHKSKGLEYPIVFCPFSWKSSDIQRGGEDQVFFHERPPAGQPGNGMSRFIHDLGSPRYELHKRLAFHERLMENLRVLYVALTRARHRCYFVWGAFNGAETSAAAWLLHPPPLPALGADPAEPPDLEEAMTAHFKGLKDDALLEQLEDLARRSADPATGPCLAVEPLPDVHPGRYRPETPAAAAPTPRLFDRTLDHRWRITSFSGLIAGRTDERPDHDPEEPGRTPLAAPAAEPIPATGIFAFPRGTAAGTCLHHIFERLDFTRAGDDAVLGPLVDDALRRHGIAGRFADAVRDNVRTTLAVPLEPGTPASALAHVAPADRMNELEFCLPVRELSPALIQQGLAGSRPELAARLGTLGFRPAEGFLRGFIDLVFRRDGRFYVVDWKSNWLGNRAEDYHPDALRQAMDHRFYGLQYHLYSLALHEYLTLRLPGYDAEKHFGGVYYLFLRGLDPTRPELGVFRDRPTPAVLEKLRRAILPQGEAAP